MPFNPLNAATRESAFVHAIASAGVAFAVTRSCAEGTSTICGCDSHHKGPPGEGWKWGGCSEDADFGVLVSREFADARENRPDARSAMNKHNNEAGRTVSRSCFCRDPSWDPFPPCPGLPCPNPSSGPCASRAPHPAAFPLAGAGPQPHAVTPVHPPILGPGPPPAWGAGSVGVPGAGPRRPPCASGCLLGLRS